MDKKVICNGASICNNNNGIFNCGHNRKHSKHGGCDSICKNQKDKGDFHCKDYNIVMRKIKLKKINEKSL